MYTIALDNILQKIMTWKLENDYMQMVITKYQQGVPTNVFLTRCLSPESNRQAETPKSPNLIAPRASMRIFPAYENIYKIVMSKELDKKQSW